MDKNGNKLSNKTELPNKPKRGITVDTSGMWFAAVALFAVLAAGIIIYRAANDDIRTASNDTRQHQLQVRDSSSHRAEEVIE